MENVLLVILIAFTVEVLNILTCSNKHQNLNYFNIILLLLKKPVFEHHFFSFSLQGASFLRSFNEISYFSGIFFSSVLKSTFLLSDIEICHSGNFVTLHSLEQKLYRVIVLKTKKTPES